MVSLRREKIERIARDIPPREGRRACAGRSVGRRLGQHLRRDCRRRRRSAAGRRTGCPPAPASLESLSRQSGPRFWPTTSGCWWRRTIWGNCRLLLRDQFLVPAVGLVARWKAGPSGSGTFKSDIEQLLGEQPHDHDSPKDCVAASGRRDSPLLDARRLPIFAGDQMVSRLRELRHPVAGAEGIAAAGHPARKDRVRFRDRLLVAVSRTT